jgi:hypothetical protein
MSPPDALEVPGTVALAMRPAAVMTGLPLLVVLTSSVMLGFIPEQPEQKM